MTYDRDDVACHHCFEQNQRLDKERGKRTFVHGAGAEACTCRWKSCIPACRPVGLSLRVDFITSRPPQRHYIALAAFRHRKDMLGPKIERLALLGRVGGAVVDSGDASLVAADMIEHRFDNMRQYSKFDNPGGDRAADVMQSPGLQFEFLVSLPHLGEDAPIKRALGIAPALEQPIPDCGGAFAACVGVHPTVKADSGDFRVSFTDGGGAIEVSGRLKSAKSVERLIKALEAGKTLFEMIGPDNKDEAVN